MGKRRPDEKPLFSVTKKDFDIQTFAAGGPGGQHQNKRHTGVRLIHRDSGARGESREHRSQYQNRRAALERLAATPAFKFWVEQRSREIRGQESIEAKVDRQMADTDSMTLEVKDGEGRWERVKWDSLASQSRV